MGFFSVLLTFKVEPIALIFLFVQVIKSIAFQQLLQDKICLQNYGLPEDVCMTLAQSQLPVKNDILIDVTTYMTWKELVALMPTLLATIYVGSWCDRFTSARRIVILSGSIGVTVEFLLLMFSSIYFESDVIFLLFTSVPILLSGAPAATLAFLSFITVNTKPENRSLRFLILDVVVNTGMAAAFFVGQQVMRSTVWFLPTKMRNYSDTFLIGFLASFSMIIWTYFFVKESTEKSDLEGEKQSFTERFRDIFTLSHLMASWKTISKKRDKNFQYSLWSIILFMFLANLTGAGIMNVLFPMFQKIYRWDYIMFSQVSAIATLVKPFAMLLTIPIIFKLFKLSDLEISIVGCSLIIVGLVAIGSIVSPVGYFINVIVSSIGGITGVGVRTFLTLYIPNDEITKVYSVVAVVDSIQPFLGSWLNSSIFSATINNYPTLLFHVIGSYLVPCLAIVCYLDCHWGAVKKEKECLITPL